VTIKKQNYGNSIQNKVAIITGSSIGRATALAFPKRTKNCVDWHESPETMQSLTDLDEAIFY
jgi:NAD(P)-dependent dehydrogenase (short-subunit alcohol dehydrogenase family)